MGRNKIDRTVERRINNFGSKMIIVGYRMSRDIDVYFPEYNWIAKGVQYSAFKKGNVKCPYERTVYGVGYLREGKYKCKENGKYTKCYKSRGDSPIGTTPVNGKYQVRCRVYNFETGKSKKEYLGYYETQEKAFKVYKEFKEKYIKQVADYYKDRIPDELYQGLYSYEVEITD